MTYSKLPKIVRVFVRFSPGLLGLIAAGMIADCSAAGHGTIIATWLAAFLLVAFSCFSAVSLTDYDL